jgi:hypothetical protein
MEQRDRNAERADCKRKAEGFISRDSVERKYGKGRSAPGPEDKQLFSRKCIHPALIQLTLRDRNYQRQYSSRDR